MKKYLMATAVILMASSASYADSQRGSAANLNAAAQAVSNSQASSSSTSQSVAQGGSVVFNNPGRIHQTYGTQTIKSAPQVVAPSMSSGHPCAFAPVSIGVSVVGFGGAFGGQRIDDACLLAQMQVRDAAIVMIAMRNKNACRALEATGNVAPGSCGGGRTRAVTYASPAQIRQAQRVQARAARPARVAAASNGGGNCEWVQATASTKKKVCN